jgi:hypothetical protein
LLTLLLGFVASGEHADRVGTTRLREPLVSLDLNDGLFLLFCRRMSLSANRFPLRRDMR